MIFPIERFKWNPDTQTLSTNAAMLFGSSGALVGARLQVQGRDYVVAFEYNPKCSTGQTMVFTPMAGTPAHLCGIQVNYESDIKRK